jgi:hypothetical protein
VLVVWAIIPAVTSGDNSRDQVQALYARVAALDPELVAAAAEQDSELIRAYLQLSPRERLLRGLRAARTLTRLRDARRPG